ncbi:MAG: hypothetical protein L0154_23400 [Chloroflexi bacterium]|nr:hypothetical protein [Chloroflexota bacterium]
MNPVFDTLPKLANRRFFLAFGLPSFLYLLLTLILIDFYDFFSNGISLFSYSTDEIDNFYEFVISLVALTLLIAVILQILERDISRILEGYGGRINPFHYFKLLELRKFRSLQQKLDDAYDKVKVDGEASPEFSEYAELRLRRTERFPYDEDFGESLIIATPFGNTTRAFELYSLTMYGIDPIHGWTRLLTVIPEDYRNLLEEHEVPMTMWQNLWALTLVCIFQYFGFVLFRGDFRLPLVPVILVLCAWFFANRARSSALLYGIMFKSAFDVYLPKLAETLGYSGSRDLNESRVFWQKYSQSIIYKDPELLQSLFENTNADDLLEHNEITQDSGATDGRGRAKNDG